MCFFGLTRSILVARLSATACLATVLSTTAQIPQSEPEPPESKLLRITTNCFVSPVLQDLFTFPETGVSFSTRFAGSRLLQGLRHDGARNFQLLTGPENLPINNSGWYAFKVWSSSNQTVRITILYTNGTHRYPPHISRDGQTWQRLPGHTAVTNDGGQSFSFPLELGPQPLLVSAQELFTSEHFSNWSRRLQRLPFVHTRIAGASAAGKPIRILEIGEPAAHPQYIVITGRQHPPEVTGTFALCRFVEALCADNLLARCFRQQFKVVVIPLVNPDGVDAGHWRHNANGVDLNRDWGQFNQPETRLIRDELLALLKSGTVRFGIDFHSTRKDVFYPTTTNVDLSTRWLDRLQQKVPDYPVRIEGSTTPPAKTTYTAASWMRRALGIPALTYESGDTTDRQLITKVAEAGAEALMELLTTPGVHSKPTRIALYRGPGTAGAGPASLVRWLDNGTNSFVVQLSPEGIQQGLLNHYDLVIFAGGSASRQASAIGEAGREQVRDFIRNGGGYLGICAGAYLATSDFSWGLKVVGARTKSSLWQRGVGSVKIELTDAGRTMLRDTREILDVLYANGPILQSMSLPDVQDFETLAWFRTELANNNTPKGIMVDSPAMVAGRYGRGRIVLFSPHPEQTRGLESFVEKAVDWIGATAGENRAAAVP